MENPWSARRARAVHLLERAPHTEEILTFYLELTDEQESVADRPPTADLLELVRSREDGFPRLRVEMLPLESLAVPFRDFLSRVASLGTEKIKEGARFLLSQDDDHRLDPLRAAVHSWRRADATEDFHFYARAFLEPVVTSIANADAIAPAGSMAPADSMAPARASTGADSSQPADWIQTFCYTCGGPPQVAVFRDLPDAVGRRSLTCSMCATEWRFQRLTCLYCGETEADKLPVHTAESIPHVRIDACTTCARYIKTVDLRKEGNAVPLVDELAAVELDIWAQEEGLTKFRTNVLGL